MRVWPIVGLALIGCGGPSGDGGLDCSPENQFFSYVDADGDGAGDPASEERTCALSDGRISLGGDCDDTNPAVSPKLPEVCDGVDTDCDLAVDDGLVTYTWYADVDGDGFGDLGNPVDACAQPPGTSSDDTDCDDTNPDAYPNALEVCDGADNDCDDSADDGDPSVDLSTGTTFYQDADEDGYGDDLRTVVACANPGGLVDVGGDCDDDRAAVNPAGNETCDGVDNDCDGLFEEEDPSVDPSGLEPYYVDADEDGYGDDAVTADLCDLIPGYAEVGGDCDDANDLITGPSLWVPDGDGDGWGAGAPVSAVESCTAPQADTAPQPPEDDCDDGDPDRFPTNTDVCEDGVDQDCSGFDAICTQPSCEDYLLADPTLPSGVYTIEPTVGVPYDVYCDMTTDGGGWTLVMSSGAAGLPTDGAGPYHGELTTMFPMAAHINPWDGMRPAVGAPHDVRFACRTSPMGPLVVDLSFYDVDWYALITNGNEAAACFFPVGVAVAPSRQNNVTGQLLPFGNPFNFGNFEGEDACAASDDFTVDFDDHGMDSNQADGTDWGSDDATSKCGTVAGNSFFIFVR